MAFRSRTRRPTRTRKRAIWVNIPFGAVAFTESVGNQLLLVSEDWEAQFTGLANETCTLRAIVGEICVKQTVAGTVGVNAFWGIYITGTGATVVPTFTTTGMASVDWLRTGIRPTTSVVTAQSTDASNQFVIPIMVKAKRKLKSRDAVFICAQFGTDVGTPAGVISGLLRFLIARD